MLREDARAARSSGVPVVVRQASWSVLMLLLTRATLLTDQSPFAIAMMAAGLAAGAPAWALWAGCVLGLNPALGFLALTPLLGCAIAQALFKAVQLLPERLRPGPGRDGLLGGRDAQTAAIALAATLVPALAASQGVPYNVMMAAANAVIAACVAPALISALTLHASRDHLMRDERIALVLVAALALMGVRMLPVVGPLLAPPVAAVLCLIASSLGAGPGAAAGSCSGRRCPFPAAAASSARRWGCAR